MSSKKDTTKEYRTLKKMNKSKIRSGQKSKNSFIYADEHFNNLNELPYGAFDKKINDQKDDQKDEQIHNQKHDQKDDQKDEHLDDENDEYEEFDPSYFEPIPYVKK